MKKLIIRLTRKDFRFDYYSGTGPGGQNRNKVKNCVRIFHDPSGTMGQCQEFRDKPKNESEAFQRLTSNPKFQQWLKIETLKLLDKESSIEQKIEDEIRFNTITEIKDENGNWIKEK